MLQTQLCQRTERGLCDHARRSLAHAQRDVLVVVPVCEHVKMSAGCRARSLKLAAHLGTLRPWPSRLAPTRPTSIRVVTCARF